jgi:acylphosphatase
VTVARHVVFRGRVQGVGFRAFVEEVAARHGIEGWVRNRRDGITVEAVFEGAAGAVEAVIEVCGRGPRSATVDAVDQRDADADELALRRGEAFAVLPTI